MHSSLHAYIGEAWKSVRVKSMPATQIRAVKVTKIPEILVIVRVEWFTRIVPEWLAVTPQGVAKCQGLTVSHELVYELHTSNIRCIDCRERVCPYTKLCPYQFNYRQERV